MHLMLHIFKKDVRRLWWGVAIALLIQIAAAWFDAVEDVAVLLHDLLMVTWAVLLALADRIDRERATARDRLLRDHHHVQQ